MGHPQFWTNPSQWIWTQDRHASRRTRIFLHTASVASLASRSCDLSSDGPSMNQRLNLPSETQVTLRQEMVVSCCFNQTYCFYRSILPNAICPSDSSQARRFAAPTCAARAVPPESDTTGAAEAAASRSRDCASSPRLGVW